MTAASVPFPLDLPGLSHHALCLFFVTTLACGSVNFGEGEGREGEVKREDEEG